MDQDQLNPYVAYEGYVVRVLHNPLMIVSETDLLLQKVEQLGEHESASLHQNITISEVYCLNTKEFKW